MRAKQIIYLTLVIVFSSAPSTVFADDENTMSLYYSQTTSDYLGDHRSPLTSESVNFIYSRELSSSWILSGSYREATANNRWLAIERDNLRAFNHADVDSSGYGISSTWLINNFSIDLNFIKIKSDESSLTYSPRVSESVNSDSNVWNVSVDSSINLWEETEIELLSFDYSVGIQHATFDARIVDEINATPEITLTSDITLEQTSLFVEIGASLWIEQPAFIWSPYIYLNWNTEIYTDGQETVLLSRGGELRQVNLLDGRFTSEINTPDAGRWGGGIAFLIDSGWSIDLVYSENISTDFPSDSLALGISVLF